MGESLINILRLIVIYVNVNQIFVKSIEHYLGVVIDGLCVCAW